jgi:3-methyl-2-oxobutanoate hydroxymethyltransferase
MRADDRPVTVTKLREMKAKGERIAALTAYDATLAALVDRAGVDIVLVGDSLGMVVQGHETTLPVTVDEMVYHTRAVHRGASRPLLIADMPFMSSRSVDYALETAARLIQQGGARMVKLEGGANQAGVVEALVGQGVPVCAHLGLQPQYVHKLGGYRVQGRERHQAVRMLEDAGVLVDAGADMLVLECVPQLLGEEIARAVDVPVIGIGAGARTDGQVLVIHDLLGMSLRPPRFSHNFLAGRSGVAEAIGAYVEAVRNGTFPGPDQVFE